MMLALQREQKEAEQQEKHEVKGSETKSRRETEKMSQTT